MAVRAKLYELLAHCIPADVILKTVTMELLPRVDIALRPELVRQAAVYV